MDAKKKLQNIIIMRSFARAVGWVTFGIMVLLFLLSFLDGSPLKSFMPSVIIYGVVIILAVAAVCLLADIASELVIRRTPKEKAN